MSFFYYFLQKKVRQTAKFISYLVRQTDAHFHLSNKGIMVEEP